MSVMIISDYQLNYIRYGIEKWKAKYLWSLNDNDTWWTDVYKHTQDLKNLNHNVYQHLYNNYFNCDEIADRTIYNTQPVQLLKFCQSLRYNCVESDEHGAYECVLWLNRIMRSLTQGIIESKTDYCACEWVASEKVNTAKEA